MSANMKPEEIVAFFAHRAEAFARHDAVLLAATHTEDGVLLVRLAAP
jgi:hypothetical protein